MGPDGLHGWVLKNCTDELNVATTYNVPYYPARITWISLPEMQLPPRVCVTALWEKKTVDLWNKSKLANIGSIPDVQSIEEIIPSVPNRLVIRVTCPKREWSVYT